MQYKKIRSQSGYKQTDIVHRLKKIDSGIDVPLYSKIEKGLALLPAEMQVEFETMTGADFAQLASPQEQQYVLNAYKTIAKTKKRENRVKSERVSVRLSPKEKAEFYAALAEFHPNLTVQEYFYRKVKQISARYKKLKGGAA